MGHLCQAWRHLGPLVLQHPYSQPDQDDSLEHMCQLSFVIWSACLKCYPTQPIGRTSSTRRSRHKPAVPLTAAASTSTQHKYLIRRSWGIFTTRAQSAPSGRKSEWVFELTGEEGRNLAPPILLLSTHLAPITCNSKSIKVSSRRRPAPLRRTSGQTPWPELITPSPSLLQMPAMTSTLYSLSLFLAVAANILVLCGLAGLQVSSLEKV